MKKQKIVISGANITSGGPLTIFNDTLKQVSEIDSVQVIAIVSDKQFFHTSHNIHFIEIPYYKKIILLKFFFEYVYYYFLSKTIKPTVWISLHDFTPNFITQTLYTYFHNASLFFSPKPADYIFSLRSIFQKFYYNYFFGFFLHQNTALIVQQNWLGENIHKKYHLPVDQIIIFRPHATDSVEPEFPNNKKVDLIERKKIILFYPTTAYSYKNIEAIGDALKIISEKGLCDKVEIRLTISGNETLYAKYVKHRYKNLPITWLGKLTRAEVENEYLNASALIFPSRLESWGLPLSEFTKYKKPIIAIDLGYAKETLRDYPFTLFFNPEDINQLSKIIIDMIEDKAINFSKTTDHNYKTFRNVNSWAELLPKKTPKMILI